MKRKLARLSKKTIDRIFEEAKTQDDYVIGLHRVVYPDWDDIEKLLGFPHTSKATANYIFGKAIAFDKEHHPNVQAGGAWLNWGFSTLDDTVRDWTVRPCEAKMRGD